VVLAEIWKKEQKVKKPSISTLWRWLYKTFAVWKALAWANS